MKIYFNNKPNTICCITILLLVSFSSCKKLVQIPPPNTQVATPVVFNNDATATQAILGIYGQMSSVRSYYMSHHCGLLADELQNFTTDPVQTELYTNSMNALDITEITGPWQNAYNYVYQANAVIEGLQKYSGTSATAKKQLTAEAKFIRAFWHFYLANCYGDVPLALSTDYNVNSAIFRTARAAVYEQVIADLKDAEANLNSNYVDATDTATTDLRVRPTSWAGKALLARVYLYTKQYNNAAAKASEVIANTQYVLETDLNQTFLTTSQEAIWQLALSAPNGSSNFNTQDGGNYILTGAPDNVALSTQLTNAFEANDKRMVNWVGTLTVGSPSITYYYPFKYKVRTSSDPNAGSEYVMVLRLAEQYLIRAEAEAQKNDVSAAISDLNTVRTRAGLPDYAGATTSSAVLSAILHERQVELFTEWGHRWFDLARTDNINAVMSVVTPLKGGSWNPDNHQALFPVPQRQLSLDANLTQNSGY